MHNGAHLRAGLMRGSHIHPLRKIAAPFDMEIGRALYIIGVSHW
ncbi:MAG: hypothetical protein ABF280_02440 [Alteriqipengyuania sp.]|jgi:hypothetical protein|tara:strand:+ start:11001 stop:11132 length:132 start_codon:yes stop_codon:yes gene_type:complete